MVTVQQDVYVQNIRWNHTNLLLERKIFPERFDLGCFQQSLLYAKSLLPPTLQNIFLIPSSALCVEHANMSHELLYFVLWTIHFNLLRWIEISFFSFFISNNCVECDSRSTY